MEADVPERLPFRYIEVQMEAACLQFRYIEIQTEAGLAAVKIYIGSDGGWPACSSDILLRFRQRLLWLQFTYINVKTEAGLAAVKI
jgi:hypothetical protein